MNKKKSSTRTLYIVAHPDTQLTLSAPAYSPYTARVTPLAGAHLFTTRATAQSCASNINSGVAVPNAKLKVVPIRISSPSRRS